MRYFDFNPILDENPILFTVNADTDALFKLLYEFLIQIISLNVDELFVKGKRFNWLIYKGFYVKT